MDHILYQIFKIILNIFKKKHEEKIDNPSIRICVNKIENRITFKQLELQLKQDIILSF